MNIELKKVKTFTGHEGGGLNTNFEALKITV